jgi:hypothetical protein
MSCPPVTDLAAPDAAAIFADHLEVCARCRALLACLEHHEEQLDPAPDTSRPAQPAEPAPPGSVWSFWAPQREEYLIAAVLDPAPVEMLIVPLLTETRWATESDIELSINTLGYPALAPVWAADHVLAEQAVEPLNMLSERTFATLADGYRAIYAGQALAEPAGPAVVGPEDPRIAAHAAIADDLRPYFAPWSELQGSEELGPVLHARREDAGIELEEWSERIDVVPAIWARFEAAQLDPYAEIPTAAIAKAIRLLKLLPSERIVGLARTSVETHHQGRAMPQAAALARRRRGARQRPQRDPQLAREAAATYAEALRRELGL